MIFLDLESTISAVSPLFGADKDLQPEAVMKGIKLTSLDLVTPPMVRGLCEMLRDAALYFEAARSSPGQADAASTANNASSPDPVLVLPDYLSEDMPDACAEFWPEDETDSSLAHFHRSYTSRVPPNHLVFHMMALLVQRGWQLVGAWRGGCVLQELKELSETLFLSFFLNLFSRLACVPLCLCYC